MRLKTSRWFETVVRYERQSENADQKKVTETYVVECETFGDAEETITREMQTFVSGEFAVKNVTPAAFGEIFFSDNAEEGNWYKAKIAYIVVDETSGKEKKTNVNYLVQAAAFDPCARGGVSAKARKAAELAAQGVPIRILDEEAFLTLLGYVRCHQA